ncbi:MAG: type II secretion system secretin GspD [Alphaproteobacteria bacterium]
MRHIPLARAVLALAGALALASCAQHDDLRADGLAKRSDPATPPSAIDFLSPASQASPRPSQATLETAPISVVRPTPTADRTRGFVHYAPGGGQAEVRLGDAEPNEGRKSRPDLAHTQRTGAGSQGLERTGDGTVRINFDDADLETVVHTVLGEQLQENYAIDAGVSGKVTLQSSRPVSRSQLLSTLQEILRMNGAALIRRDGLYTVVRAARMGGSASGLTFEEASSRGLTVRVTPLRHSDVSSIGKILERFAPAGGEIFLDDDRDLVFTVATAAEQDSLLDVISVLDVDYLSGLAFALQPLEEADALTLVGELRAITLAPGAGSLGPGSLGRREAGAEGQGRPTAGGGAGDHGGAEPLRFLPIERMNAILVVARSNDYLEQALTWINRLDQGAADTEQLFVYPVMRRQAAELAALISQIFNLNTIADEVDLDPALAPGLDPVDLTNAPTGGGPRPGSRTGPEEGKKGIRIIADRATNTLVIYATAEQYEPIKAALDRLDVLPKQVLIEATLVEVSLTNQLEYGVRWFFQNLDDAERAADPDRRFSRTSFSDLSGGGFTPQAQGFNYFLDAANVQFVLSALRDVTDVEVLSSPNMMVLDNQTARLQVGDEVPIQTRAATDVNNPGAPVVNDIDYRDTGVILNVTPRITSDGLVVLDIIQEVSEVVATGSSDISSPTIQQRKFESTVAVGDGESVVLGGLTRNFASLGRTGVPVLSRVPLVGNLFTSRSNDQRRTELMVLIKPRVIRDQSAVRVATDEMKRKLRDVFGDKPSAARRVLFPLDTRDPADVGAED